MGGHGVPHTLIVDNAGGHLMQRGEVDMVIVGTDRTTAQRRRLQQDRHLSEGAGGARQRRAVLCRPALADHRLDGRARRRREIPIEERSGDEVTHVQGRDRSGRVVQVQISPDGTPRPTRPST
jgi:methylthioribose-1-phosphate isomerase